MKMSVRKLAQYCGVSIGTVDRVLNNRPGVKKQTKELVEKAVRDLHYTPNYFAKGLSIGKSMTIGVVLFNLHNPFFAQLSGAIVKQADAHDYFPYFTLSERSKDKEFECVKKLIGRQVDGIILFSINRDPSYLEFLNDSKIPIVTIMTQLDGFPSVGIDDFAAMADATSYIASRGYDQIVYVSPPLSNAKDMNTRVQERRLEGFVDKAHQSGMRNIIISDQDYLSALNRVDFAGSDTAVLCSSDVYALEIQNSLRMRGLVPPFHYGLMGFDNDPCLPVDMSPRCSPALPTSPRHSTTI